MTDEEFFRLYSHRHARIRKPQQILTKTPQRAMHYAPECEGEFNSLGDHKRARRRILLWRVPADNPHYDPRKPAILKIPFLAFSDEEIADRDDILLPLIHEIMSDAREKI